MTLHLRPISDADHSPVAGFPHVNLNCWPARGNLASKVIDGTPTGPELESHRNHAGAAVANLAELRIMVPPPSFILSAPQVNKHMGFYLRRGKPSLCSPFQGV